MKSLLVCGLIILSIEVKKTIAENPNMVKVVGSEGVYINESYVDVKNSDLKVIKVNETYNRLYVKGVLLEDFPQDIRIDVEVQRSRSCDGPWEKFRNYSSHICDQNDKYRKALPHVFIDQTQGGKCLQKGKYEYDDGETFKFYELLPEEELQGYYFKTRNILRTDDIEIATTEVSYQTNGLPTCPS